MTETIAGVTIPDTVVVKAATELVLDADDGLLFHHSRRVYLWGMLKSRRRGHTPDPELTYVGAMFHDLGLTPKYRTRLARSDFVGAACYPPQQSRPGQGLPRQRGTDLQAEPHIRRRRSSGDIPGL